VRELDKLGAEDADVEKYLTTLARALTGCRVTAII
jgi:hypothetical protein